MTDVRADEIERERERERDEDDRLPWLEAAEEEESGPSPLKLIGALVIGLLAIGVIVGGLFWLGNRAGSGGNGEIIAAPEGPYKMRSDDPGMQVDNRGASQVATSEGVETNASIDRGAATETPVTGAPRPDNAPRPADAGRPGTPAPAQPDAATRAAGTRPAPAAGGQPRLTGPLIQVGSYPSEAIANSEWTRMSGRFPYLRGLQHNVVTYQAGNKTFYRLRAGGDGARAICARLVAARQPCYDVPAGQ